MGHSMYRPNWQISIHPKRKKNEIQNGLKEEEKKYKMTTKSGKSVYLQACNLIDPATGWIEIRTVPSVQVCSQSSRTSLVNSLSIT